jgi:hypothetical protein
MRIFILQPCVAWIVALMVAVIKENVSATQAGQVIVVTCCHVIQGAQSMVSARTEHVSAPKAGMENTALFVSNIFILMNCLC